MGCDEELKLGPMQRFGGNISDVRHDEGRRRLVGDFWCDRSLGVVPADYAIVPAKVVGHVEVVEVGVLGFVEVS